MSKKIVAMLMAVAMAFSLLPVTAFATGETSGTTTGDVVDGHYNDKGNWESGKPENAIPDSLKDTVTTVDKTAKKVDGQDNQYDVTLTVQMKHKTTEVQPGAAATVLVIDKSGSMDDDDRLSAAKTAAINFLKSYSGFSKSNFGKDGKLGKNVKDKNLNRYVSLVTFNSSASVKKSWIDVSTRAGYNKLLSAINDIEAAGGTNLDAALRLANTQMQSKSITQIDQSKRNVIALTDGVPTYYVGTGWVGNDKNVSQHGNYGCPDTNIATATSATALKANVNAVYTVCFGAAGDQCWTKGSAHAWTGGLFPEEKEWHQTDGPTVGDFLKNSIATQPANGSNKQYAYNAVNADKLYEVFAAITQTITEGLNEGVVTDGLPTGVTAVQGSGFEHTWTLDSSSVTPTTSNGYNVYTYTKTYKVNVDPATVNTVEVGGANYAPLNTPTILTVQHNGSPVQIPFPIPAIRINITQATVTFKVENGTWSDGETGDKTTTVTMINGKGTLPTSAVPTEMKANANYEGGAWDTTPNTETNGITGDATYTYSFTPTSGTATVTFKVENGTWNDGTNADKTVTVNLSAGKGTLSNSDVPTEMKANANYEGGAWDTTPNTKANGITGDATYTYSFAPTSGTATVTFKVENGTWNDGTNADKTVTVNLSAGKGTLSNSDVPTEMKANANYEGGAWDTTPNTKANGITGDATYTYSFAPTSGTATVTFKVENGTWNDGTNADKTVTVNLSAGKGTLSNSDVPTEMKANANYEGGAWDTTPNTKANGITGDATYTYSFAPTSGTAIVTFKVENGTWNDGTNADKTVTVNLSAGKGTLSNSDVPTEMKANANYEGGAWDTTPNTKANGITGDATYTYSFAPTSGTATVTFKVENGTWNDGTNADKTVTVNLSAGKGTLSNSDVPTEMKANANYEGGAWDTTPNTKANGITGDATYTYSFVPKKVDVNLSDLIKKELTVKKDSELPTGTTFNVTVTPQTANSVTVEDPQPIPGTVSDLGTGNTNGDGDTIYTASFDFGADGTLSLSAGTYTYTVQENANSPISGMKYDSNTYTLTIAVKNSEATVKYTTGEGSTAIDVSKEEPLTIQNTYQTPDLTVEKKTVSVAGKTDSNTVAHVNDKIIWSVTVTNKNSTPAHVTLTDAMAEGVYTDDKCETQATDVNWDADTHSWTATVSGKVTYYVNYTVKEADIPNGKIVNTIVMKNGDEKKTDTSDPVSTWDTKQLKSATSSLNTSDWTTTVTLELPTVSKTEQQPATQEREEVKPDPIAVKSGSYVIDQIGNEFTFMDGLSLKVNNKELSVTKDTTNKNLYHFRTETGGTDLYTVTYTDKNDETKTPAQFKWEINENIPAGTKVTLSYKLKLTNPNKTAGTHGVTDLNGDGKVDDTGAAFTENDKKNALYTNESATLYKDANTKLADFPKPSVSYTVSSGSSGSHSGGSRPSLNTKDHYGYIIGYPVDYYTGQPTTDQTKKPVRPEGKITRAEVATIYFRMLTDESRTKFWSQSSGYSDVKAGDWFNNAVSTLSNAGIIAGYEDGSFRPNGYITRAEFATIAARFFDVTYNGKDLFPDISGHWAKDYINQAANKGFVNGYEDGTFKPDRNITRAEAVTLVNRTLDRHPDKSHFTKDMLVWPDNMDQTKWYYADMQEATNSHTYQMKENSDKTKYENWTKTLPIRNWEALEKAWSNANSSQGNGNVV